MSVYALASWLALYGCHDACAAGITANLIVESGGYPCIGGGYMMQWKGYRRSRYESYAAYWGKHPCDTGTQLGYIMHEMAERGVKDWMLRVRDPGEAAAVFNQTVEQGRGYGVRASLARRIYPAIAGRF